MKKIWKRREFLFQSGGGISGLALAHLLNKDGYAAPPPAVAGPGCAAEPLGENPYAPKAPHFKPRATAVISLFMSGAPSHLDLFDPKPMLDKYAGQPLDSELAKDLKVRQGFPGPLMPSPFKFQKYGESGMDVSELFPHIAQKVDEIAFIRSVYARSNDHVQAHYDMHSGQIRIGFPSMGSWITYGLGSENQSLPGFVVIHDARGGPFGGPNCWSAGYMPAAYQGTMFRPTGDPIINLQPPEEVSPEQQRGMLDTLARLNQLDVDKNPGSSELAARISSYELAYRMQSCAPEIVDISGESEATKDLYGINDVATQTFGRQCLLARRLVERGVRFVQLYEGGTNGNQFMNTWDAHNNLQANHMLHAKASDQPIAALLTDLKAHGLLDSTLVIWHGEFGRMPISQRGVGRDHNPGAQTIWMAGAGIQGGQIIGSSDDFGYKVAEQPTSIHDVHATILHLLGLDHTKLTYRFNGRDMRLTDVYGELIPQIVA